MEKKMEKLRQNNDRGVRQNVTGNREMASREDFLTAVQTKPLEKSFINYYSTEKSGLSITRKEFQYVTGKIVNSLSESLDKNFEFIGLHLKDYLLLPCLLMSIWKLGKACACIGNQYSQECNLKFLNVLNVKFLIDDSETSCFTSDLVHTFRIHSRRFHIWKIKSDRIADISNKHVDFCYGIMTSGSTGLPKIIKVPWSCILPNVFELVHLLGVTESDNIYLSSPYTFDPFFVELFMAFIAGSTLSIVSHQLKMSSETLLEILFENKDYTCNTDDPGIDFILKTNAISKSPVTIAQMTPSLFKSLGFNKIKEIVLADVSPLRALLLGGEKFPIDILKLKSNNNKTQIYNIYGITEISCWAFVKRVTGKHGEVSLGSPLNDIFYKIDENNELFIGSKKRRCFINDERDVEKDEVIYRRTGDIVTVKNSEIYYVSRTNQIVKKFGIKVNLEKIENIFLRAHKHLQDCFCIFDETKVKLGLFYTNDEMTDEYHVIDGQKEISGLGLTSIEVPDFIIEIPKVPLNSNGKCDKKRLLDIFREIIKREERGEDVETIFKRIWTGVVDNMNFITGGGDSVKALQIVTRLEESGVEVSKSFLPTLLTDGDYGKCLSCVSKSCRIGPKKITQQIDRKIYKFAVAWTFDTKKCVDASPTVFGKNGEVHAVVGSHSSRLSSVKVDTGQENWTINLTDRIESGFSVNKSSTFGVIGCYDQHVYCLSTADGRILWKYKTGGMVKSTPCLSSHEENVYVASYDTFLYCLQCRNGELLNKLKLSDRGIYSSGVVSEEVGAFFIGTLDGTCVAVSEASHEIMWKERLGSPIFASPVLAVNDSIDISIIFTEVIGQLHCFNATTGTKMWRFECNGCVYSTPVFASQYDFLVFPCYDNYLYCLKFSSEPSIMWKVQLDSPGFSTPCLFSIAETCLICTTSTKGWLYLFELDSGSNNGQMKLNGEVFSSPKMNINNVVVGCRDNNLYCIRIDVFNR